jgi:hypothetical protein
MKLVFESSERSDEINWVKKAILAHGLGLIAFEGYTVLNNKVSAIFDRALLQEPSNTMDSQSLFSYLNDLASFNIKAKLEFASKLNTLYYFVTYSYSPLTISVFQISAHEATLVQQFNSFKHFGEWTAQFRDLIMSSDYQESVLPQIDREMRSAGIPWPGNLDYALINNNIAVALIEFQRTSKTSVSEHSNNKWFLPTKYRKGDVNRWLAIDIIRKQSALPLLVIVWSHKENVIKLKSVSKIVSPHDAESPKGLIYRNYKLMYLPELINILRKF